ncbi:NADH dehydrogenase [ubiquinone] 1 beta subcomplex subunit 2, mitochondrial [Asbolus verrucosus]|uniref:NADH dehydrogenase [ubiquinone] 1 beta subcomplex subunit 2, mitochondrial n=1 Tax=Asbolus verrucosus TaxID=1661398 RepID=A0A482VR80_ASBVE|nr:NADH dehydrogenase [ubiquinone] 1 beta subcomplex subunit 2, mitochondrial [Asbolus verrucosus]
MLLSRGLSTLKAIKFANRNNIQTLQSVRNSHAVNYRTAPEPPPKFILTIAEVVQGIAWWWVLWHIYTEPGHILGEFEYPDPRKWTDEELGIPPIE